MTLTESLKSFVNLVANQEEELYSKICKVKKVYLKRSICDVEPLDGGPMIHGVKLQTEMCNNENDNIPSTSFIQVPKEGSTVLVNFVNRDSAHIASYSIVEKVSIGVNESNALDKSDTYQSLETGKVSIVAQNEKENSLTLEASKRPKSDASGGDFSNLPGSRAMLENNGDSAASELLSQYEDDKLSKIKMDAKSGDSTIALQADQASDKSSSIRMETSGDASELAMETKQGEDRSSIIANTDKISFIIDKSWTIDMNKGGDLQMTALDNGTDILISNKGAITIENEDSTITMTGSEITIDNGGANIKMSGSEVNINKGSLKIM
ncbi:hypothetical protein [Aureibacter tunicatorum]|uniref:Uncharacterized protein n=1 Tax=Aureibacter tunicatorum TaxID=866807 RepID=A0AAE3XSF7_9BACT|nr:hypothetical protein [Aureibacter tunicatorum]MDR6241908.1 hypothetical protein [Aureibacter tunicatorum]BDD07457.1 hypothetical protein AUTU_49400 [Aureibacter tunicatorum]